MKKTVAILLSIMMCTGLLAACGGNSGGGNSAPSASGGPAASGGTNPVTLRVVSSFAGTDGNREHFETAYRAWEAETGNTVEDESQTSDEAWKAKVVADFETGSEPDVLFFYNGNDANSFIESGKVVPIEEIREKYPEYASNMNDASIPASTVDGKQYAVPTTGYWEGLFANTAVLEAADVELPGPGTTWDEFLEICQKIKDAGYTPIAASLQNVPHYWFEFTIMNNGSPKNHLDVPTSDSDPAFKAWAGGLNDIKDLYEKGFFPANTLSASDEETFQLMYDGDAAFAIDGSWKVGQIVENVDDRLADYTVTYVPGKGERQASDIVGGLSMGYYITRKAWEDPDKQAAAVSFIEALTTDEVVNKMAAGTAATALKNKAEKPSDLNTLQEAAFDMINGASSVTPAVQDYISPEAKNQVLITDTKLVANGDITAEEAVQNMMDINNG